MPCGAHSTVTMNTMPITAVCNSKEAADPVAQAEDDAGADERPEDRAGCRRRSPSATTSTEIGNEAATGLMKRL